MIAIFIYLAICLLFGCILCFRGEKMFLPTLQVIVLFFSLGICISRFGFSVKGIMIATAVSVVMWVLFHFFYKLAFFSLGAMGGAMLGAFLNGFLPISFATYAWLIPLALALVMGICCAMWRKEFMMLTTAYSGATLIIAPLCFLFLEWGNLGSFVYADGAMQTMFQLNLYLNTGFHSQQTLLLLIGTAILTAVGFICQKKSKLPE